MKIAYDTIKQNEEIRTYIDMADDNLEAMGYTEHSFAHVGVVTKTAAKILREFKYSEDDINLVKIAAFMHDIGNNINRADHAISGANMAFNILRGLNMDPVDIAKIVAAIGNHDEGSSYPVSPISAALILADKCDVRRNRVRKEMLNDIPNIHYNVNYSVSSSKVTIDGNNRTITLDLVIDTTICSVMEYFEIFLKRMKLCKLAASKLNAKFILNINGQLHS